MVVSFDIKGHTVLVDEQDAYLLEQSRWYILRGSGTNYVTSHTGRKIDDNRKTVRLHGVIMRPPTGLVVDHINFDGLDNRRDNLRICTPSQNSAWKRMKGAASGFRGVYRIEKLRIRPWEAYLRVNNDRIRVGYFKTKEDAARAYDIAAMKHFGEFAVLNFPNEYPDLLQPDRGENSHYVISESPIGGA